VRGALRIAFVEIHHAGGRMQARDGIARSQPEAVADGSFDFAQGRAGDFTRRRAHES